MQRLAETLRILADGNFHSGEELAQHLNVSRGTVWKQVETVREAGLDVFAVRGRGYRLAQPFELLEREQILGHMDGISRAQLGPLDIHWSIESTNGWLMEQAKQGASPGHTVLSELQTNGRGRRGRFWQSPLGGNIYLSQLWHINEGLSSVSGLSLATAVALIRALRKVVAMEAGVKWPNDILVQGKKLAGILLEISGEPAGPCHVVVGLGINVKLSNTAAQAIDQPWTDLYTLTGRPLARNRLVAQLIMELMRVHRSAEQQKLLPYLQEWRALDSYLGKQVELHSANGVFTGVVRGIDNSGALQLAHNGQLMRFHSGEVSLRPPVSE
jgi:BirA family biotin operon repressor/biotin-[acetyl-CoA-carboxylase] ligase